MNNTFLSFLENHKLKIENALNDNFKEFKNKIPLNNKIINEMISRLEEYSLRGGKRIRPALMILGHYLFDKNIPPELYKIASILEMIHAYLLIHDDVMDKTNLRRGKDTMHVTYSKDNIRKNYDSKEYGNNMAIIAGDILSSFAYSALISSSMGDKSKIEVLEMTNDILFNTCIGQALDMIIQTKTKTNEQEILNMYRLKTAKYSIEGPLTTGARIASSKKKDLKVLSDFSIPLGVAFQLQDDLLDMFQSKKDTGKDNYSDLKEGKRTLLLLKTLQSASSKENEFILSKIGKDIDEKDAIQIKKIMLKSGAKKAIETKVKEFINESKKAVKESKLTREQKKYLSDFAEYILKRKK